MSVGREGEEAAQTKDSQHMRVRTVRPKRLRKAVPLNVNVEPQKKNRIQRLAVARGVTLSEAVDAALTAYVTGRPPVYRPNPRSRLVAAAVETLALLVNRLDLLTAALPDAPETLGARFEAIFVGGAYREIRSALVEFGDLVDRLAPFPEGPAAGPGAGTEDLSTADLDGDIRPEGGTK